MSVTGPGLPRNPDWEPKPFDARWEPKPPVTGWKKWAATLGGLVVIGLVIAVPTAVVWLTIWALGEVFN